MKLLLDEMLKKAVRFLRIFGMDAEFAEGRKDSELLKAARDSGAVLVTRDAELYSNCVKAGVRGFFVKSNELEEQLAEMKNGLGLEFTFPEKTRCPSCNNPLEVVPRSEVQGLVKPNVLEQYEKFQLCRKCNKAYWEGSHWKNITRIYEAAERLSRGIPDAISHST
jgi:uncharacterized protein with PIN domain